MKVKELKAILAHVDDDVEVITLPENGYTNVIELADCSMLIDCVKTRAKGKSGDLGEFNGGDPLLYLALRLKRNYNRMHCVPRELGQ